MKETIAAWNVANAAAVIEALQDAIQYAREDRHARTEGYLLAHEIYSNPLQIELEVETLTDESRVYNLRFTV